VCYGTLSWHVKEGRAGDLDLSDLNVAMSLRYHDEVQPSTPWEVVLYVDERADDDRRQALADRLTGMPVALR